MSELLYSDKNIDLAKFIGRKGFRESYQIELRDGHFVTLEFIDEEEL